MNFELF
jgi:dynein heavy chain 1, cytosolic